MPIRSTARPDVAGGSCRLDQTDGEDDERDREQRPSHTRDRGAERVLALPADEDVQEEPARLREEAEGLLSSLKAKATSGLSGADSTAIEYDSASFW